MTKKRRIGGDVRWIYGDFVCLGAIFRVFAVDCFRKFLVVGWSVCE